MWNRQADEPSQTSAGTRPPGVVDTIGMGFETLLSRPLLIVPPVLLDLYLWLGVHISSEPVTMRLANWMRNRDNVSEGAVSAVEQSTLQNINELAALWMPSLRMPSFLATIPNDTAYRLESWRPAMSLSTWSVVLAGIVLLIVGLVIGAEYLLAIAAAVARLDPTSQRKPGTGVLQGAWRLASWYLVVVAVTLLVFWPFLAGFLAAEVFGTGSSFWLILFMFIPLSWAYVIFFFSVQAMFMDQTGPLAALRSSYQVVKSDSWRALGIIFAYFLVTVGFPQVWLTIATQPVGLVVSFLGHAIIGTGMIAATMVFYRDRVHQLNVAGRI